MAQLVECVPNFSEGRNKEVIAAISLSLSSSPGCSLLDVDSGASTHRNVFTFVGSPESVVQGALNAASTAFKLIDMTRHSEKLGEQGWEASKRPEHDIRKSIHNEVTITSLTYEKVTNEEQ
ncbi:Formimidoyltransferase-cyclodeaminase, partial [Dissostichus eleginoides]